MERRMTLRRALTAAGLVLGLMALGTCSNPIDLLKAVETEVKLATGKFLGVLSVTPNDVENVNPGQTFAVVFDRGLDQTTITEAAIEFDPPGGITGVDLSYTAATKTLTVHASPYLANSTPYTVMITTSLKGADGSELKEAYAWGFTTGIYPAGSVYINDNAVATTDPDVELNLQLLESDQIRFSFVSEWDLLNNIANSWVNTGLVYAKELCPNLTDPDGLKTVWVQFRDKDKPAVSLVQTDSIYLDRAPPTVDAGTSPIYLNISYPTRTLYASASDASSGIQTYQWSGTGLTFSSANTLYTTVTAGADSAYTATLTVTDHAGYQASDSVTIIRDTVAPGTPTFTAGTTTSPTLDNTPTWAWASGGGGNGTFEYWLDTPSTEKPTDSTADTSLTISGKDPLPDGSHYLIIRERDNAGNRSATVSRTIVVTPVLPVPGSSRVPTTIGELLWRPSGGRTGYAVFFWRYGTTPPKYPQTTTTERLGLPALLVNTQYYWYYYDDEEVRHPTSGSYTFETGK